MVEPICIDMQDLLSLCFILCSVGICQISIGSSESNSFLEWPLADA